MIKNKLSMMIICLASIFGGSVSIAQDDEHHLEQRNTLLFGVDSPAGKVVNQFHHALKAGDKVTVKK